VLIVVSALFALSLLMQLLLHFHIVRASVSSKAKRADGAHLV
jgi:hypothetical protein